ncbi:MAG: ribose-phosphate pyrophosphokinase [Kiritimatiellae bacterium]|nr:ribose-phosphate pyrophosphokinase [Kiritimatiellia bacterium]
MAGGTMFRVFAGNSNRALAEGIARYVGQPLGEIEIARFPDGEIFVKILEHVRGLDIFIVQSICHPPNENLMELLIMIDAAKRASAERITAVIPFFGYARQDRKDQPSVPITAKLVANLIVAAGANRVLSMDFHSQQIQGFFDIPVDHLYAAPVMVEYLIGKPLKEPVVVSPDPGGLKMAVAYAEMLGGGLALVAKQRKGPTEVEASHLVGEVNGRDAIMVDDLTTTAGTLTAAARLLEEHGARDIYAVVSHAVIAPMAIDRLKQSRIKELVVTDSVPIVDSGGFPITVLSVADLLGEAVLRIHRNESVTDLFKVRASEIGARRG